MSCLPVVRPEIAQIGRRLILFGRHQKAIAATEVMLLTDGDVVVALAANLVAEPDRLVGDDPLVDLVDHPRPGERMVNSCDVVVQQVRIGLVEIDALLDYCLVVRMQRDPGGVVDAGPLQAARLDHQRIVPAVAVLIEPLTDGIAQILWFGRGGRKVAAIRVDAAIKVVVALHQNISRAGSDHDFHRPVGNHDPRHARRKASRCRIDTLPAERLVGEIGLVDRLILRRQRWFLSEAEVPGRGLAGVVAKSSIAATEETRVAGAAPLTLEVGILAFIERRGAANHRQQCGRERGCTDRVAKTHAVLPPQYVGKRRAAPRPSVDGGHASLCPPTLCAKFKFYSSWGVFSSIAPGSARESTNTMESTKRPGSGEAK